MRKRWNRFKRSVKKTIWSIKFIYKVFKLFISLFSHLSEHSSNRNQNQQVNRVEYSEKEEEDMKTEILADLKELEEKFKDKDMKVTLETLMRKDQLKIRDPKTDQDNSRRTELYLKTFKKLRKENLIIEKESGELKLSENGLSYLKKN